MNIRTLARALALQKQGWTFAPSLLLSNGNLCYTVEANVHHMILKGADVHSKNNMKVSFLTKTISVTRIVRESDYSPASAIFDVKKCSIVTF